MPSDAEGLTIEVEDGLLLHDVVWVFLAERDDSLQDLDVIASAFGFRHDLLLLIGDVALFGLKPLVTLDKGPQLLDGDALAGGGRFGVRDVHERGFPRLDEARDYGAPWPATRGCEGGAAGVPPGV